MFTPTSISVVGHQLAVSSANTIKLVDFDTLAVDTIAIPGVEATFSALNQMADKIAVIGTTPAGGRMLIVAAKNGDVVGKLDLSPFTPLVPLNPTARYAVSGLQWLGDALFVSVDDGNLHCFTADLEHSATYKGGAARQLSGGPVVVVAPSYEDLAPGGSTFDLAFLSVTTFPSKQRMPPLAYSMPAPTCEALEPFDLDGKGQSIVKGYWWRGGGGFFRADRQGVTDLDELVNYTYVRSCHYIGDNVVVQAANAEGGGARLLLIHPSEPKAIACELAIPAIANVVKSHREPVVYGIQDDGLIAQYAVSDRTIEQASTLLMGRDSFMVFTPELLYLSKGDNSRVIRFTSALRSYPFEQFDLRLNRPDVVLERLGAPSEAIAIAKQLREKRLKRMGVTQEMLKPDFHVPELEIVGDVPATTDAGEINLTAKASDSKYPLERLKVFVNNVPVNGREGESLRDQNTQTLERTIPIKLAAGRNKIQVSVLNSAGAESLYANAEINCTAKRPRPTLYAVAMGVSEYANPEWNLRYAAKDAKDVLARLKDKAGSSYGEVKELLLTDKEVTKESLVKIREFLSAATIDDTVLLFVAGHGLLDSKYDYYFGTTDIDFNNPADKGIAFEGFDDILADLPCLKKSLLVDTCHAGELDEDEKTLLASAGGGAASLPTGQGVAVRSIGTRGMNVKAVEGARGASEWYDRLQGLFVDLRRGSGSTILSSSAGAEYALESSEQQNGLFTYAVLEALDGKEGADANKDGSVQMSEVGEYVKKRVAELTKNKQIPNTRRVNLEGDFPVARTQQR